VKITIRAPGARARRLLIEALFYIAAACLFASLLTAPGQLYLGRFYYLKDIGAALTFFTLAYISIVRRERLATFAAAGAGILLFIFLTAVPKDDTPATELNMIWVIRWALAVQLGHLAVRERLGRAVAISVTVLLAIICVDSLVGLWEIRTQDHFFEMSALDETAAGVTLVRYEQVEDLIRVLALHRSGGDFGNSMATGMIMIAFLMVICRRIWQKALLAPFFLLFTYDLFFSTLRSFLVGAVAGVLAVLAYLLLPRRLSHLSAQGIALLIGVCLFFSYFNIIPMVEWVSSHLLSGTAIGDVNSSYMRIDSWDDVVNGLKAAPLIAIIGSPLASALSLNLGAPPTLICDNIYLWFLFHFGIFGWLAILICIPIPLATRASPEARALYFAAAAQLLVTGIFTDSFFYFSSLILFFALGLILGQRETTRLPAPARIRLRARPAGL